MATKKQKSVLRRHGARATKPPRTKAATVSRSTKPCRAKKAAISSTQVGKPRQAKKAATARKRAHPRREKKAATASKSTHPRHEKKAATTSKSTHQRRERKAATPSSKLRKVRSLAKPKHQRREKKATTTRSTTQVGKQRRAKKAAIPAKPKHQRREKKAATKAGRKKPSKLSQLSRKTLLKKLRETEKKIAELTIARGQKLTFRNKKGRFVNPAEWQKEQAKKRVEKLFKPIIEKERLGASRKYPVDDKTARRMERLMEKLAQTGSDEGKLTSEMNRPVRVDSRWEGAFSLTGLPDTGDLEFDFEAGSDKMRDAVLTMLDKMPFRKGMMVSMSLIPEDTVLLLYGRDRPFMHTHWRRADSPEERDSLYPSLRGMAGVMAQNKWRLRGVRVHVYYDRRMAVKGKRAKR